MRNCVFGSEESLLSCTVLCVVFLVQHGKPHLLWKDWPILPNTKHMHSVLPNLWQSQKVTASFETVSINSSCIPKPHTGLRGPSASAWGKHYKSKGKME